MKSSITRLATLALLFALFTNCDSSRQTLKQQLADKELTTFYLVRHAEKDYGDNPNLTKEGLARAERLKEMLKNIDLAAVYSTNTKRTLQTARPTADDHGLEIIQYNASPMEELSGKLRRQYKGRKVLIVGHSNTTPKMTNYLIQEQRFPRFSELDYTNFFIVNLPRVGAADVQELRF